MRIFAVPFDHLDNDGPFDVDFTDNTKAFTGLVIRTF